MTRAVRFLSTFFVAIAIHGIRVQPAPAQSNSPPNLPSLRQTLTHLPPARDLEQDLHTFLVRPYLNIHADHLTPSTENCKEQSFRMFVPDPLRTEGAMRINLVIYRPLQNRRADSMLIYPSIMGVTYIEKNYAEKFCDAGFTTLIIQSWPNSQFHGDVAFSTYDEVTLRGYVATRHAIDFLGTPVGIFGTSQGGMSALSAGILFAPQVKAVSSIAAALPFSQVVAYSNEETMLQTRTTRMQQLGLKTQVEYLQFLQKKIRFEPLRYLTPEAAAIPHQLFIATEDESVPSRLQEKMAQFFTHSDLHYFADGHLGIILSVFGFHQQKVIDFFLQHLH